MAETKFQSKSADKMILLKAKVSESLGSPTYTSWGSPTASWAGTLELYDEDGNLLGYIPYCDNANLV